MRKRNKQEYIIEPTTKDFLTSLFCYTDGCRILLENTSKEYADFLEKLLTHSFYYDEGKKWSIKDISEKSNVASTKVVKWLKEIYYDIFELNENNPLLFKKEGIPHYLFFQNYDMNAYYKLWLPNTPSLYNSFTWDFLKAKVATSFFWVKQVTYDIEQDGTTAIHINLKGGFYNQYESFLKDRALFEGVIGIMEEFRLNDYELKDILLNHYRK